MRYSQFVRFVKIILLLLTVGVLLGVGINVAVSYWNRPKVVIPKDWDNPTLVKFQLIGRTDRDDNFLLSAQKLYAQGKVQDKSIEVLDIRNPKLLLHLADAESSNQEAWVFIHATRGLFHDKDHILSLMGAVTLLSTYGYEGQSEEVRINLKDAQLTSRTPFHGRGPLGIIDSDGIMASGKTQTVELSPHVRGTIYPQKENSASTTGTGPLLFSGQKLILDKEAKCVILEGNVHLNRDGQSITCTKLVLLFQDQRLAHANIAGPLVACLKDGHIAQAEYAVFDPATQILTLWDNVRLTSGSDTLTGQKLTVNMANGQAHLEAAPGGKIHGHFSN